ncbi:DUF2130 domain-containing protein, partial [Sphingomonas echinoides]
TQKLADRDAAIEHREAEVRQQKAEIADARAAIETQVAAKLSEARQQIADEEAKKAKAIFGSDLETKNREILALQEIAAAREQKLAEAQREQGELLRKQRELDDARRELEITVEKRVSASLEEVRVRAKSEAEESLRLKVSEKEEQISSMQRQIEDLRRKAEQGSQQLQGEVLELQLETMLASRFPMDVQEPVAKGEFGGDLLHRVVGPVGQMCGSILWETKRTKNWSDGWLSKLRTDQRAAKAELAILISDALPKGIESFDCVDGVWVAHPRFVIPIAVALRQSLIDISATRTAREGQETKMELVYNYLIGSNFRHRIEAIVERFAEMQADLNRERKATMRLWAKREAQIQGVIDSTVGMYGDLQGIVGRAMQEIPALEIPLMEIADQSGDE